MAGQGRAGQGARTVCDWRELGLFEPKHVVRRWVGVGAYEDVDWTANTHTRAQPQQQAGDPGERRNEPGVETLAQPVGRSTFQK